MNNMIISLVVTLGFFLSIPCVSQSQDLAEQGMKDKNSHKSKQIVLDSKVASIDKSKDLTKWLGSIKPAAGMEIEDISSGIRERKPYWKTKVVGRNRRTIRKRLQE